MIDATDKLMFISMFQVSTLRNKPLLANMCHVHAVLAQGLSTGKELVITCIVEKPCAFRLKMSKKQQNQKFPAQTSLFVYKTQLNNVSATCHKLSKTLLGIRNCLWQPKC